MMTDDEGFAPESYLDCYETMIEYMVARDNGFEGDYRAFREMQQQSCAPGQDESTLRYIVKRLMEKRGKATVLDIVYEAMR